MDIFEFFKNDKFAFDNGIQLVKADKGYAESILKVEKKHLNAGGYTQGGAIFTLTDFTVAVAANSYGKLAVSLNSGINFFKSSKQGDTLKAVAKEIFSHKQVPSYEVNIYNQNNEHIASFIGNMYVKDFSNNIEIL